MCNVEHFSTSGGDNNKLPGDDVIPPLHLEWVVDASRPAGVQTITTDPIAVCVVSVLDESGGAGQLRDIASPMPPSTPIWVWCLAAIPVLALAWLAIRRRRQRAEPEVPVPRTPPHLIALQALQRLLDEGLIERGEFDLFHTRLSWIVRRYIEHRFGYRMSVRTSDEFVNEMRRDPTTLGPYQDTLREFLTLCDRVKFARWIPDRPSVDGAVAACRGFLGETGQSDETDACTSEFAAEGEA